MCLEDADLKDGSPEGPSGLKYDIFEFVYSSEYIMCYLFSHNLLCYSFFRTVYIVWMLTLDSCAMPMLQTYYVYYVRVCPTNCLIAKSKPNSGLETHASP